ncbi:MAG: DNA-protecting protein DprA [Candidatus Dormibacteraeota bacterium]|nr:DNA-protecting protein DprA [Candidatus Dormibacteraeota bacterium]
MSGGPRQVSPGSPEWPERLSHLDHPPQELWVRGPVLPGARSVAVVGSRRATPAGLSIARELGGLLGEAGVNVISGLARGVDGAAHLGALDAGGPTTAVLGCGIDVCYPRQHAPLSERIAGSGCILTEEPPGTQPFKANFPKRNRIIAALVAAVVVVEGTERSGALSTARWAADLGREVLAVPGSIRSPQSRGTNLLIRDGARPYLGPEDLVQAVPGLAATGAGPAGGPSLAGLRRPLLEILERMGPTPVYPDELGQALALPAPLVAARLGELEVAGAVLSLPGGLVARTF